MFSDAEPNYKQSRVVDYLIVLCIIAAALCTIAMVSNVILW